MSNPQPLMVIADLCIVPLGEVSVSEPVAACVKILREAGLNAETHAYGTNVEGTWQEVFDALEACHRRVHDMGYARITTTVKVGSRVDRKQTMRDKVESVERRLGSGGD